LKNGNGTDSISDPLLKTVWLENYPILKNTWPRHRPLSFQKLIWLGTFFLNVYILMKRSGLIMISFAYFQMNIGGW
jgi:hypothetical protein